MVFLLKKCIKIYLFLATILFIILISCFSYGEQIIIDNENDNNTDIRYYNIIEKNFNNDIIIEDLNGLKIDYEINFIETQKCIREEFFNLNNTISESYRKCLKLIISLDNPSENPPTYNNTNTSSSSATIININHNTEMQITEEIIKKLSTVKLLCHDETILIIRLPKIPFLKSIYLINIRNTQNLTDANTIIITDINLLKIDNLQSNSIYNISIIRYFMDLSYDNLSADAKFKTLQYHQMDNTFIKPFSNNSESKVVTLNEIENVYVKKYFKNTYDKKSINALLKWIPTPYTISCYYNIYLHEANIFQNDDDDDQINDVDDDYSNDGNNNDSANDQLKHFEYHNLNASYTYLIENLKYSTKYMVAVERSPNTKIPNKYVKKMEWFNFITPSCYELYFNNISVCPPSKLKNIQINEYQTNETNVYDIEIKWNTPQLPPDYYFIKIFTIFINEILIDAFVDYQKNITTNYNDQQNINVFNVSGHLNETLLNDVKIFGTHYELSISAVSTNGITTTYLRNQLKSFDISTTHNGSLPTTLSSSSSSSTTATTTFSPSATTNHNDINSIATNISIIFLLIILILLISFVIISFIWLYIQFKRYKRKNHLVIVNKHNSDDNSNTIITDNTNRIIKNNSTTIQINEENNDNNNNDNNNENNNTVDDDGIQLNSNEFYINDEMEISYDKVKLLEILGEGAFGIVKRGVLQMDNCNPTSSIESMRNNKFVAIKMLKSSATFDDIREFHSEIQVLKSVGKHPNIIRILGHYTKDIRKMMLITEYCSKGNLLKVLQNEWDLRNQKQMENDNSFSSMNDGQNKSVLERISNQFCNTIDNKFYYQLNTSITKKLIKRIRPKFFYTVQSKQQQQSPTQLPNTNQLHFNINQSQSFKALESPKSQPISPISLLSFHPLPGLLQQPLPLTPSLTKPSLILPTLPPPPQQKIKSLSTSSSIGSVASSRKSSSSRHFKSLVNNNNNDQKFCVNELYDKYPSQLLPKSLQSQMVLSSKHKINRPQQQQQHREQQQLPSPLATSSTDIYRIDEHLTYIDLLLFAKQIAIGMEFLTKNKIIHRDLAARNILVCSDNRLKISDFGLSRDIYQSNIYKKCGSGKLPIKWLALESLTRQVYTTQSDVWSYGILLYEIFTFGSTPYPSMDVKYLLRNLLNGYRMECPSTNKSNSNNDKNNLNNYLCTEEIYQLMLSCWKTIPNERPTFTDIVKIIDDILLNTQIK